MGIDKMKTTITISVDGEIKDKAMKIIQNEMNTSLSAVVNKKLHNIVKKAENKQ